MWSLAWPWALLALPLPWLASRLLPEAVGLSEAGLRVPNLNHFETLKDRSDAEQLLNWRVWVAVLAWILLVLAAARPERIGDELDVPVAGRNVRRKWHRSAGNRQPADPNCRKVKWMHCAGRFRNAGISSPGWRTVAMSGFV